MAGVRSAGRFEDREFLVPICFGPVVAGLNPVIIGGRVGNFRRPKVQWDGNSHGVAIAENSEAHRIAGPERHNGVGEIGHQMKLDIGPIDQLNDDIAAFKNPIGGETPNSIRNNHALGTKGKSNSKERAGAVRILFPGEEHLRDGLAKAGDLTG